MLVTTCFSKAGHSWLPKTLACTEVVLFYPFQDIIFKEWKLVRTTRAKSTSTTRSGCSPAHCFHSPAGIDADLGNKTSTGPTNQVGESERSSNKLQYIRAEGLVKHQLQQEM